jgi:hypothetical protein
LTDPFKTIRLQETGSGREYLELIFMGRTVPTWSDIPAKLESIVCSSNPLKDYGIFSRYFVVLRQFLDKANELCKLSGPSPSILQRVEKPFSALRLHGDIPNFRKQHHTRMIQFRRFLKNAFHWSILENLQINNPLFTPLKDRPRCRQDQEEAEHAVREAECLLLQLEDLLPRADADVRFYGYSLLDKKLRARAAAGEVEAKPRRCDHCGRRRQGRHWHEDEDDSEWDNDSELEVVSSEDEDEIDA